MMRYHQPMRTTIDIDDDLLIRYREKARKKGVSIGRLISQRLRALENGSANGSETRKGDFIIENGFTVLAPRGEVITHEHVMKLIEEDENETSTF